VRANQVGAIQQANVSASLFRLRPWRCRINIRHALLVHQRYGLQPGAASADSFARQPATVVREVFDVTRSAVFKDAEARFVEVGDEVVMLVAN
jgi:hypothetical protein